MSADPRFTPAKPDLPSPDELLTGLDAVLKTRAQGNARDAQEAVRGELPSRTGRTRQTTRGTARSNRLGYRVTVDNRDRAHVVRFVSGGTGTRGGFRRIPKNKRGRLPNGAQPTGRGQRPQNSWKSGLREARKVTGQMQSQMADAWRSVTGRID